MRPWAALGVAALTLLASEASSAANALPDTVIRGFSKAMAGDGFVAMSVGTVPRPASREANRKRGGSAFEDQLDNMDFFYATEVDIGTPPQKVTVLVDTGSSELWVNPDCNTAPTDAQAQQCIGLGRYDARKSQTPPHGPFGKEVINYGDPSDSSTQTSVSIRYYADNMALGGAHIRNQTFGVVYASKGQAQGIMGLAPPLRRDGGGGSGDAAYSLVLSSMAQQGVIASRVFALDLRRHDATNGAVIYGGLDRSKFVGALERRPMVRGLKGESRLAVDLSSVGVTPGRTMPVAREDAGVMLDSGTTITRLHATLALPILNALGARDDGQGYYRVPCAAADARGSVDFGFGATTIRVPFRDFILRLGEAATTCYAGLVQTTDQQILGESVLRAGYFVFDWDNDAVHLAQAADCGSQDIVTVGSGVDAVPRATGHCMPNDAAFSGSPQSTQTREDVLPTEAYTTVYTITACPFFDHGCRTGVVTTRTLEAAPSSTAGGARGDGKGDKDNAGARTAVEARRWGLAVAVALVALYNAV